MSTLETLSYQIVTTHMLDPLAAPMLADLAREYAVRYSKILTPAQLENELSQYPEHEFSPPNGAFVLVVERGQAIAGGAFRRRAEPERGDIGRSKTGYPSRDINGAPAVPTAELKRIWTHRDHRRKGLGSVVVTALEERARDLHYRRLYLTTGPKQPEAEALYLKAGYTPLYEFARQYSHPLPFEKWLTDAPKQRVSL